MNTRFRDSAAACRTSLARLGVHFSHVERPENVTGIVHSERAEPSCLDPTTSALWSIHRCQLKATRFIQDTVNEDARQTVDVT